jgi:hypothetical protein
MNCRGVEGFPFVFLVSLLVLCIVFVGGFFMIDSLNAFNSETSFLSDVNRVKDVIVFLKTCDVGSFSRVIVSVPSGMFLVFEGSNIKFGDYSIPAGVVFKNQTIFESGIYELVFCYGVCEEVAYLVEFE